jgi:DNA processing protein
MKMNAYIDITYWIAISHLPKWTVNRTNCLIVAIAIEKKISWPDFFASKKEHWKKWFDFTEKELNDLENAKADMPRIAFIAEQLQNEGFQIIPIISSDYPQILKENLKYNSPSILYIKGRKELLNEFSVAIVGSRKAGEKALLFTDLMAKINVRESKVIVSGFAKGVDQQALESALEANGKSIIVLPQGILTFQSGFRKYYEPIVNGNVLVLSTFFPKAGWEVGLAMARNAYIYGLAKEIIVSETESSGGTWEGALSGLKKGRKIFVRQPDISEKNANNKLIELGAIPLNNDGKIIINSNDSNVDEINKNKELFANETISAYNNTTENLEFNILDLLGKGSYTTREIASYIGNGWSSKEISNFLKTSGKVKVLTGKTKKYTLESQSSLDF